MFCNSTKLKIKVKMNSKISIIIVWYHLYFSEEFDLKKHVERFKGYDSWTSTEYSFCQKVRYKDQINLLNNISFL